MASLKIATESDAVEIGEQGIASNKCVTKSVLSSFGCKIKDAYIDDYTNNQLVAKDHLTKSKYVTKIGFYGSAPNESIDVDEQDEITSVTLYDTTVPSHRVTPIVFFSDGTNIQLGRDDYSASMSTQLDGYVQPQSLSDTTLEGGVILRFYMINMPSTDLSGVYGVTYLYNGTRTTAALNIYVRAYPY